MLTLEPTESHAEMTGEQKRKGEEGGSHMDPGKKTFTAEKSKCKGSKVTMPGKRRYMTFRISFWSQLKYTLPRILPWLFHPM